MKNEMLDSKIAKRISYYRKKKNLSVDEVALSTGMSKAMIYAYESGKRQLTVSSLLKLADLYDVSLDDMIGTKHTLNREKSVSFELYRNNKKERTLVSSERDDIIFFKKDEWNTEYYIKSNNHSFNNKLLIELDRKVYPVVIRYDENKKLCVITSFLDGSVCIMSRKEMLESIFVLGEYAGTITKQKKIDEFFD